MTSTSKKFESITEKLAANFSLVVTNPWILVDISEQHLYLMQQAQVISSYLVSTSKFGIGGEQDSQKTPLGAHQVAECIGQDEPIGTIFQARQTTGELAEITKSAESTNLDLVITRILRLRGIEPGINQGDGRDSYNRYIYIHGTHEEGLLGTPASHGCVRMASTDIIQLYNRVTLDTFVYIT